MRTFLFQQNFENKQKTAPTGLQVQ